MQDIASRRCIGGTCHTQRDHGNQHIVQHNIGKSSRNGKAKTKPRFTCRHKEDLQHDADHRKGNQQKNGNGVGFAKGIKRVIRTHSIQNRCAEYNAQHTESCADDDAEQHEKGKILPCSFISSLAHLIGHQRTAACGNHRPNGKRNRQERPRDADGRKRVRSQQIGHKKLIDDAVNVHEDIGQDRRQRVFQQGCS